MTGENKVHDLQNAGNQSDLLKSTGDMFTGMQQPDKLEPATSKMGRSRLKEYIFNIRKVNENKSQVAEGRANCEDQCMEMEFEGTGSEQESENYGGQEIERIGTAQQEGILWKEEREINLNIPPRQQKFRLSSNEPTN